MRGWALVVALLSVLAGLESNPSVIHSWAEAERTLATLSLDKGLREVEVSGTIGTIGGTRDHTAQRMLCTRDG